MVSRVKGSLWLPQLLYAFNSGAVSLEIDGADGGPVEDLQVALASPLVEAEVGRLIERTGTTEYVVAPVVAGSSVIALVHADTKRSARPLSTLDRDLLRLFADAVGLIYERAGLAERVELQRRKVAEACGAAMRSLNDFDDAASAPTLKFGATAIEAAVPVNWEPAASLSRRH